MILHIAFDSKFVDAAYNIFENIAPKRNKLVISSMARNLIYAKMSPYIQINILNWVGF